jgi:YD repeat-containing protein
MAAVLLIALSGFAGYWLTQERIQPAPVRTAEEPVARPSPLAPSEPPAAAPRITRAIPSATPLPIAVADGAFSPSFSADGQHLFFHLGRDRGRLMEVALGDDERPRAVIDDGGRNYHVRPSPDGQWLAFDSDRNGTRGVFIARGDGSAVQRVSGDGFAAVPSWSPDMKWLAFVRGEPSKPTVWNLWLRDVGSGELRRLSAFRAGQVWSASWFPDGKSICYSHDNQIIVADLASNTTRVFETPVSGRLARTPAVSPDGSRIVFQVLGDGIWMIDVASGSMRRVSDDGSAEEFAWDPGGRRIAYHSRRDGQWRIWLMEL